MVNLIENIVQHANMYNNASLMEFIDNNMKVKTLLVVSLVGFHGLFCSGIYTSY